MMLDWYAPMFGIVFTALVECVVVSWIYGMHTIYLFIVFMSIVVSNNFYILCLSYV